MPDFLFRTLSIVANAIFVGGEHAEEFWGVKRDIYKTTDGVRRKEKSISPARINVLIKGVKDIWQTAI